MLSLYYLIALSIIFLSLCICRICMLVITVFSLNSSFKVIYLIVKNWR